METDCSFSKSPQRTSATLHENNSLPQVVTNNNSYQIKVSNRMSLNHHNHNQATTPIESAETQILLTTTTITASHTIITSPSNHHHNHISNKENLKAYFDEEPMDIDSSMNAPATPAVAKPANRPQPPEIIQFSPPTGRSPNDQSSLSPINNSKNFVKPNSGPKIVKPIRPNGKVIRPVNNEQQTSNSASSSTSSMSNNENYANFEEELDLANINPFQPRKTQISVSPVANQEKIVFSAENNNEQLGVDLVQDEWETHKKRSATQRKSQQNSPNRSSSAISSTTDMSSSGSSPTQKIAENKHQNPNELQDPFRSPPPINRKLNGLITDRRSESAVNNNNNNGAEFESGGFCAFSVSDVFGSGGNNFLNSNSAFEQNNTNNESFIFDSIFSNENEFQSFLDLLEKKEVDNPIKNTDKYSEFARKSLYIQFDPIVQNLSPEKLRRISVIKEKKEAIRSFLSEISEKTEEQKQKTTKSPFNGAIVEEEDSSSVAIKNEESSSGYRASLPLSNEQKKLDMAEDEKEQNKFLSNGEEKNEEEEQKFLKNDEKQRNEEETEIINGLSETSITNGNHMLENNNSLLDELDVAKPIQSKGNQLIDDLDSLKLETMTSSMTSSYSNKTHDLINRTQNFLEKANLKTKASTPEATCIQSTITTSKEVELFTEVNNSSGDKSYSISSNGNLAHLYNELLEENKKMKQQETAYKATIDELRCNQQEFFQIMLDFEEALKMAEQEKQEREEKLNKEILELTRERDNLQMDVIGVETANKDFQRRFEIVRVRIDEFKENEKKLYEAIQVLKQQTEKEKQKYVLLKKHAEEKLDAANIEIEKLRKSTAIANQTLGAELRKAEIKISSLELTVQQKENENTELTNLLDELLAKVKPT